MSHALTTRRAPWRRIDPLAVALALVVGLAAATLHRAAAAQDGIEGIVPALTGEDAKDEKAATPADNPASLELLPDDARGESVSTLLSDDPLWRTFFDREEMGFSLDTFSALEDIGARTLGALVGWWFALAEDPLGTPLLALTPFVLLALALSLWIMIHARAARLLPAARARVKERERWPVWAQRLAITGADLLAQLAAPALLTLLALLTRASPIGQDAAWAEIGVQIGVALLLYRVATTALHATFGGVLIPLDADRIRGLSTLVAWALRLTLAVHIGLIVVEVSGYRADAGDDVAHLLRFTWRIALAVMALRLLSLKPQALELFGEGSPGSFSARLRSLFSRYYPWLIVITVLLLVLWAVGFTNAATYVLTRVYAIVALLAAIAALQRWMEGAFARRRAQSASADRRESLRRVERASNLGVTLLSSAAILELLGLQDVVLYLLQRPLLRLGAADISLYAVGKALLLFGAFLLASRLLRFVLNEKIYPRFGVEVGVGYAINTVANYTLILVGILAALVGIGVRLGALTVFAGALGVGIGFGLQDMTRNLISGFILLFGRSVKKGDVVQVDSHFGVVEGLGARAVHLVTPDNQEIVIPSSKLVESSITNYTYTNPTVRIHIPVGVHYGSDVRQVEQALLNAARRHAQVLQDPPPGVWLTGFGDSSVNFDLLVWIDVRRVGIDQITGELNFHVWDVLKEQGIEIPYPQRDLHLREGPLVRDLVRALRGEPPAPPPAPTPGPELKRHLSYISTWDQGPPTPLVDARQNLTERLRADRELRQRGREFRRFMERYFTGREATLTRVAALVGQHVGVELARHHLDHDPLNALLDDALAQHRGEHHAPEEAQGEDEDAQG